MLRLSPLLVASRDGLFAPLSKSRPARPGDLLVGYPRRNPGHAIVTGE